jgi:hypothetical protein
MAVLAQMTQNTMPSPALLQRHLRGMHYPAGRDDLINHARSECARVIHTLEMLPDRPYTRPTDVSKAMHDMARDAVSGASYPATRDDLVQNARDTGADPAVVDVLTVIPDDTYDSPDAVVIEIIEVDDE